MAGGSVHVPWYATGLRADTLAAALAEIAPIALRYGATSYHVYRMQDDRYRFVQISNFGSKSEWEQYWYGPEFTRWRAVNSSYYQVPVVYGWADNVAHGVVPWERSAAEAEA